MKSPADWWMQRQAEQRYIPGARPRRGTGTTAKVAAVVLVLIGVALVALELRDTGGEYAELAAWVEERAGEPETVVANAIRGHRMIFLTDIAGASGPKALTARVLERHGAELSLDVLALQADPALQPRVDRYLISNPEDASILLSDPRLARDGSGAGPAWVDLFRAVYAVNRELGPTRAIRVILLDREGWPPGPGTGPHDLARAFAGRDSAMAALLQERVLERDPQSRVLFLVDGLNALGGGGGAIQTGGTGRQPTRWLPVILKERYPTDVWVGLVDAAGGRSAMPLVAGYRGTVLPEALREAGLRPPLAVPLGSRFAGFTPGIRVVTTPGMSFDLEPLDMALPARGDAWIWLGG